MLQQSLPGFCPLAAAVEVLASAGVEERGAVFTRGEVVDFILDLSGYTADKPLHEARLLEPSFGDGDFLLRAIDRLLTSYKNHGGKMPERDLARSICGVELHHATFEKSKAAVISFLGERGIASRDAQGLANAWLHQGDFLLAELDGSWDYVVGNPPYVRQELIPQVLIDEYRRRVLSVKR